jgi:hypothetical protein
VRAIRVEAGSMAICPCTELKLENFCLTGCIQASKNLKTIKIKWLRLEIKQNELNKTANPYTMKKCHDTRC